MCNQGTRPNAQMFKKLNMCFTKTCTAYKHQQYPTKVMVIDSQAPVALILFGFGQMDAVGKVSRKSSGFFRIFMWSKHSNMIAFRRFNRQIPNFDLDFDLVKASNRLIHVYLQLNCDNETGHRKEF